MAKVRRGGKTLYVRNTANQIPPNNPTPTPTPVPQPTPTPAPAPAMPDPNDVANGNVLPPGGVPFDQFMKMNDNQKAQVITDALNNAVPLFLDDSNLQHVAYFTGMVGKPQLVDDTNFNSLSGKSLYRTINDVYDRTNDINMTASDIYKQITTGDYTMYSDSGGSAYGKGIYFASSASESSYYGRKNPTMMKMKYAPGTKTISTTRLSSMYNSASGTALYKACRGDINLFALANGYDAVTDSGSGYNMVLNRKCMIVSKRTVKATRGMADW